MFNYTNMTSNYAIEKLFIYKLSNEVKKYEKNIKVKQAMIHIKELNESIRLNELYMEKNPIHKTYNLNMNLRMPESIVNSDKSKQNIYTILNKLTTMTTNNKKDKIKLKKLITISNRLIRQGFKLGNTEEHIELSNKILLDIIYSDNGIGFEMNNVYDYIYLVKHLHENIPDKDNNKDNVIENKYKQINKLIVEFEEHENKHAKKNIQQGGNNIEMIVNKLITACLESYIESLKKIVNEYQILKEKSNQYSNLSGGFKNNLINKRNNKSLKRKKISKRKRKTLKL